MAGKMIAALIEEHRSKEKLPKPREGGQEFFALQGHREWIARLTAIGRFAATL